MSEERTAPIPLNLFLDMAADALDSRIKQIAASMANPPEIEVDIVIKHGPRQDSWSVKGTLKGVTYKPAPRGECEAKP